MKSKDLQPRLLYPARLSFKIEGEIKTFSEKKKLKEFVNTKPLLQVLKDLLKQEEEKEKKQRKIVKKQNGSKNISINNHFKCKWLKCSNQKTYA